jgi:hypothetical protein
MRLSSYFRRWLYRPIKAPSKRCLKLSAGVGSSSDDSVPNCSCQPVGSLLRHPPQTWRLVDRNREPIVVAEKRGTHPGDFPDVTSVQSHRPLHPQPANSSPATPVESQVVPGASGERLQRRKFVRNKHEDTPQHHAIGKSLHFKLAPNLIQLRSRDPDRVRPDPFVSCIEDESPGASLSVPRWLRH